MEKCEREIWMVRWALLYLLNNTNNNANAKCTQLHLQPNYGYKSLQLRWVRTVRWKRNGNNKMKMTGGKNGLYETTLVKR